MTITIPENAISTPENAAPTTGELRAVVAANIDERLRIEFFEKSMGCVQCGAAKRKMERLGVYDSKTKTFSGPMSFSSTDVAQDAEAANALRDRGLSQAPVFLIFFEDTEVASFVGFDADRIDLWMNPARAEDRSHAVAEFISENR